MNVKQETRREGGEYSECGPRTEALPGDKERKGGGVSTANVDKGQKHTQMEDVSTANVDEGQKHAQMGDVSMVNMDKGWKHCLETRRERGGGYSERG